MWPARPRPMLSGDRSATAVLEPPKPSGLGRMGAEQLASAYSARKPQRNRRGEFSLLIVRGDGVRVLRFNFVKTAAVAAFVGMACTVSLTAALFGDWVKLRELTRDAVVMHEQLIEQRAAAERVNRRVADLRQEMAGWRDLHAKIWEPFGPELTPGGRDKAVGGPAPGTDRPTGRLSPAEELNKLGDGVREQTDSLKALERMMTKAGRALAALPSRWPVRGAVNSEFGNRPSPWTSGNTEFHAGLDIKADRGTPVYAPAAGSVVHAGTATEYGTAVVLEHSQDVRTLYGHLSKVNVQPGQKVERGAVIGYSGNTGRSTGPHLHYEVLVKGHAVNPRAYLWD
jgi:murein DD-endopeptidase MepM/ murein hydrolase activator NlpD